MCLPDHVRVVIYTNINLPQTPLVYTIKHFKPQSLHKLATLPPVLFISPNLLCNKSIMEPTESPFRIILGSSSIARRKILAEMGYEFTLMSADIDEKAIRTEKPEELVMALAKAKADAIVSKLQTSNDQEKDAKPSILIASDTAKGNPKLHIGEDKDAVPTLLITCDQVVVYEGVIREKPSGEEEARQFIKSYSGKHASTVSSVFVTNLKTGFTKGDYDKVEIHFHEIPDHVIDKLLEEGLVLRVAGALIIEHPLIVPYVKDVKGTTDSVMGLPKELTEKLLKEAMNA